MEGPGATLHEVRKAGSGLQVAAATRCLARSLPPVMEHHFLLCSSLMVAVTPRTSSENFCTPRRATNRAQARGPRKELASEPLP